MRPAGGEGHDDHHRFRTSTTGDTAGNAEYRIDSDDDEEEVDDDGCDDQMVMMLLLFLDLWFLLLLFLSPCLDLLL
jgi:hypothetical protein